MEDDHQSDEVEGQTQPESESEAEAERMLREALARIDQVDDVQQRFLSQARRQVSELHVEATRARAAALETARKVVADAEAEAASVLEAARQEVDRVRAASEQEVKAHAEVLLAVAYKERDELMAEASAAADRLREEAALTGESLLNTAQTKAIRLVQEAKEEAACIRAPSGGGGGQAPGSRMATAAELRRDQGGPRAGSDDVAQEALRQLHQDVNALAEGLAHSLEGLAERIAAADGLAAQIAVSAGRTFAAHRTPAPLDITEAEAQAEAQAEAPPAPACGDPVPLIGSRGNQSVSSAGPSGAPPSHAGPEPDLHPQGGGPAGRGGSHWDHSLDWPRTRRGPGWRRRGA
ncbi:MAG: hypothetical protein KY452_02805 [Actinobacteria bacterium]|nr:hypothetical protein [Actinomycetota bacterium]